MRRAFTLIEVMIATAILAVVVVMVYAMLKSSTDAFAAGGRRAGLNKQARDLLDRLAAEIADAGVSTLQPPFPNGATALTFRRNTGYTGGAITFGAPITYAFAYEPGEYDNGIDDNQDGRVDEGRLVRTENNGDSVILSRDIAEGGITFTQAGNTVRIVLTLELLDERREPVRTTIDTTIQIRN
ncbi:MAG: prepilin-type N-terminal cleavage/methylation domain-containing protein [Planctomycetes bacterium]|nr:prepilin-type N-terminal cleavage/methylation domain-containing protein [Planctomycetota bacterium]